MKLVQALCRDKTELEHSGLFFPRPYKSERADSTGKYYITTLHIFGEILQEKKIGRSNLT